MNNIAHPVAFIAIILVCIVLIIINYITVKNREKYMKQDKRCMNCKTKDFEDFMEIRCRNKRSKFHGYLVDDYSCCDAWKGVKR